MCSRGRGIGIIGHGKIGSYVYKQITSRPELGFEIRFVCDKDEARTAGLPKEVILDRLEDLASREVDMVAELAHPDVSREFGTMILEETDYFLLSVTALADAELEAALRETALRCGTRVFVPHGGLMGLDAIVEGRDTWDEVKIVMKKNPKNIDFARSGIDPSTITGPTVLYDGPTRGVCPKFPRNVNTHATLALGGVGFDRTHSTLIADPSLDVAIVEVYAHGGGVELELKRSGSITGGVTGVATLRSVMRSLARTTEQGPGLHLI